MKTLRIMWLWLALASFCAGGLAACGGSADPSELTGVWEFDGEATLASLEKSHDTEDAQELLERLRKSGNRSRTLAFDFSGGSSEILSIDMANKRIKPMATGSNQFIQEVKINGREVEVVYYHDERNKDVVCKLILILEKDGTLKTDNCYGISVLADAATEAQLKHPTVYFKKVSDDPNAR